MPEQRQRLKHLLHCAPERAQPKTGCQWHAEQGHKSGKAKQRIKAFSGISAPVAWELKPKSVIHIKELSLLYVSCFPSSPCKCFILPFDFNKIPERLSLSNHLCFGYSRFTPSMKESKHQSLKKAASLCL